MPRPGPTRPEADERVPAGRDAARPAETRAEELHRQAAAAQARAADAHRRSAAARAAADRAGTEYARGSHSRVADLHARLASSHEERARALLTPVEDLKPN